MHRQIKVGRNPRWQFLPHCRTQVSREMKINGSVTKMRPRHETIRHIQISEEISKIQNKLVRRWLFLRSVFQFLKSGCYKEMLGCSLDCQVSPESNKKLYEQWPRSTIPNNSSFLPYQQITGRSGWSRAVGHIGQQIWAWSRTRDPLTHD